MSQSLPRNLEKLSLDQEEFKKEDHKETDAKKIYFACTYLKNQKKRFKQKRKLLE